MLWKLVTLMVFSFTLSNNDVIFTLGTTIGLVDVNALTGGLAGTLRSTVDCLILGSAGILSAVLKIVANCNNTFWMGSLEVRFKVVDGNGCVRRETILELA